MGWTSNIYADDVVTSKLSKPSKSSEPLVYTWVETIKPWGLTIFLVTMSIVLIILLIVREVFNKDKDKAKDKANDDNSKKLDEIVDVDTFCDRDVK